MPRSRTRTSVLVPLLLAAASTLFVACGGGGGGNGGGGTAMTVVNTSFQGYPSFPGGGLPPVIRDEVLELTFGGPIDVTSFGGFYVEAGMTMPTAFQGGRLVNGTTVDVPYFAFADQAAARQAVRILDDTMTVTTPWPGVVGVHATKPNTIIFDPNVNASTAALFNIQLSQGLNADNQYDVFIPANSGLKIGGQSVPSFGSPPPVTPPTFQISQPVSTLFRTGAGFLDRPAPSVLSQPDGITTENTELIMGAPGFSPIPYDDTIIVRFSEAIDIATIDLQNNLIVRNTMLTNTQQPNGVLVPVVLTIDSTLRELRITPQPSFGSGPFPIVVQVVKFDETDPVEDAKNIRGLPSGATATQKALAGLPGIVAQVVFTTIAQPGEPNPVSVIENFDSTTQQDTGFNPVYNPAEWFANSVEELRGFAINGAPFPTQLGTGPGARVQFTYQPAGTPNPLNPNCTTALCAYSSPFDDNQINNGLNPNGGSRMQLLYLTNGTELPNQQPDSLELVEWSPPNQVASMVTYNGYSMEVGHTGNAAGGTSNSAQMTTIFPSNFDFSNPQNDWIMPISHPFNTSPPYPANDSPILCYGPAPYTVTQLAGTFIPFPRLTLAFDIDDTRTEANSVGQAVSPHIIIEHEVPAPHITQNMMVNVVVGTNETTPTPFRRAIGSPGVDNAIALDAVKYHTRLTIAKKNSAARSKWYATGATSGATVNYNSISITPPLTARPAGTRIQLRLESATSASGANASTPPGNSPNANVYFDKNGNLNLGALIFISGAPVGSSPRGFFRFTFDFEANLLTNQVPTVDSMIFGVTF